MATTTQNATTTQTGEVIIDDLKNMVRHNGVQITESIKSQQSSRNASVDDQPEVTAAEKHLAALANEACKDHSVGAVKTMINDTLTVPGLVYGHNTGMVPLEAGTFECHNGVASPVNTPSIFVSKETGARGK